ncbi:5-oxoprolinase subunit PpxA [Paenibacillus sp. JCM 10914]|uniref:LamB/YcsF family protein n=1 Tax=Paenibacillus sp. JCM 10914 TaxID=1236974 RepID=UPI0003CCA89C|nr:5-oxoprolinase subunit PxpA [Paenibacillus sp. JCM 10914]GAE05125.1 lactam utilization protein LamB [Paenibacillus sp. JCM 10914]
MVVVDLNCDMGESFGNYAIGSDTELLGFITSANIACGYHAGDPAVMRTTVQAAMASGAAVGAHPGLPDLAGFGRRKMEITPQEAHDMVTYQIGALMAFVQQEGGTLHHVKPHGALYNMAAVSRPLADAIVAAVQRINPALILYGLAGSELIIAGEAAGLCTASEVFADRTYQDDGTLTPRQLPGAVITDLEQSLNQVLRMVRDKTVITLSGSIIPITADTICIHGDGAHASVFAKTLRIRLEHEGVLVRAMS